MEFRTFMHNGGDNGNGILEILKMLSLLYLVEYLGQFNVTSYILHNAGSAQTYNRE